jgi:hypothetical protein
MRFYRPWPKPSSVHSFLSGILGSMLYSSVGWFSLFVRTVGCGFLGRFWKLPRFFFFLKKFHFENHVSFQNLEKFWLGDFQDQWVLQNFELSIFKGGSHKSILINQGFLFFIFYFLLFWGFFFVSFLIIIINDELSKLINDEIQFALI